MESASAGVCKLPGPAAGLDGEIIVAVFEPAPLLGKVEDKVEAATGSRHVQVQGHLPFALVAARQGRPHGLAIKGRGARGPARLGRTEPGTAGLTAQAPVEQTGGAGLQAEQQGEAIIVQGSAEMHSLA